MPDSMPPLNAVRAFNAAAKHKSFTRAAEDLFVTHGAISRQVKILEEFLGCKLFERAPRGLILTQSGRQYSEVVADVLDRLCQGTAELMREPTREHLTISVLPSFASRWLVPRLESFYEQYPDWEILISASLDLVDFDREQIDLAIRYGRGRWAGLESDYLFSSDTVLVCAPSVMQGPNPLRDPEDLVNHRLLHTDSRDQWTTWLRLAHVDKVDVKRDPVYTDANITIQAAVNGQGIALANRGLVRDELNKGRLITPFSLSLTEDVAYYVVYPRGAGSRKKIRAIRDWLLEQARVSELEEVMERG